MTTTATTKTVAELAASVAAALHYYGPVSAWYGVDQDTEKSVALNLSWAVPALVDAIGDDEAKRDEAKAIVRAAVAKVSTHAVDKAQADRLCRAIHRGWMVRRIRRHPRADRFRSLTDALTRGRFTEKQLAFAKQLLAEVPAATN